ncbi:MAG: orotidine 5'-phosphate decarboxylase / HUMPS family protein [bacterium]
MKAIVQVSLDIETIEEALKLAHGAVRAGVDWIEAGTPLILGEGLHAVKALRREFPDYPIVADLKTMDGGGLECEMMAKAGASMVVVMSRAHWATVKEVVAMARKYNVKVMADVLAEDDKAAAAKKMEEMGVDYIIVHTGYDERRHIKGVSPLDDLGKVLKAVKIPVQAVGGLSVEQAIEAVKVGARLFVIGAPLVIDVEKFAIADDAFESKLKEIVETVRNIG